MRVIKLDINMKFVLLLATYISISIYSQPSDENATFFGAMLDYNAGKYYEAINKLTPITKTSTNQDIIANAYCFMINSYIGVQDFAKAGVLVDEYIQKYPKNNVATFAFLKIKIQYHQQKYNETIKLGYEFLKNQPPTMPYQKDVVYYYIAQSYYFLKDYKQALTIYKTTLELFEKVQYKDDILLKIAFIEGLDEKDKLIKIINKTRQENIELIKKLNE